MTVVKSKSIENIKAAELLIKKRMYAASVHCAYYSCFQLSSYTLAHYCKMDYQTQEDLARTLKQDSHTCVCGNMRGVLRSRDEELAANYHRNYAELKKMRKKADYSSTIITHPEAEKAKEIAEKINIILNSYPS